MKSAVSVIPAGSGPAGGSAGNCVARREAAAVELRDDVGEMVLVLHQVHGRSPRGAKLAGQVAAVGAETARRAMASSIQTSELDCSASIATGSTVADQPGRARLREDGPRRRAAARVERIGRCRRPARSTSTTAVASITSPSSRCAHR